MTSSPGAWLELSVVADVEAVEAVSEILGRVAPGGTSVEPAYDLVDDGLAARIDVTRPAVVRAYVPARDPAAADAAAARAGEALGHLQAFGLRPIGELTTRVVHEADWADAWKRHFPVLRVGQRLVIRPTWRRHRPSPGDVVLALDPGMAFGTGTHPTTRLCLTALEDWIEAGETVFDVGTGSGILAIAAALLGASHVDAVDIEPVAVRQAAENLDRNDVTGCVRIAEGSADAAASPGGAYDLVLANIIARILIEIATDLVTAVKPGGTLILSGIIEPKEAGVLETFRGLGLELRGREQMEDWVAHVWTQPGS